MMSGRLKRHPLTFMLLCQESTQQGAIKQEMMPINIREKMLGDGEKVFKITFKSHFYIKANVLNSNIKAT